MSSCEGVRQPPTATVSLLSLAGVSPPQGVLNFIHWGDLFSIGCSYIQLDHWVPDCPHGSHGYLRKAQKAQSLCRAADTAKHGQWHPSIANVYLYFWFSLIPHRTAAQEVTSGAGNLFRHVGLGQLLLRYCASGRTAGVAATAVGLRVLTTSPPHEATEGTTE